MPALQFDRAFLIGFKMYASSIFPAARAAAQAQPGTLGLKKRGTGGCYVCTNGACIWEIGLRTVLCHAGLILPLLYLDALAKISTGVVGFKTNSLFLCPNLHLMGSCTGMNAQHAQVLHHITQYYHYTDNCTL